MDARFGFAPDQDNPGWHLRPATVNDRFADIYGEMRVRVEAADRARIRLTPQRHHRNIGDTTHGGFLLAVVDQAYFIAPVAIGIAGAAGGSTIESATQFLAPVAIGRPIDVVVEVLRETGRMIFLRGLIEQDGAKALAFSGTIRKAPRTESGGTGAAR